MMKVQVVRLVIGTNKREHGLTEVEGRIMKHAVLLPCIISFSLFSSHPWRPRMERWLRKGPKEARKSIKVPFVYIHKKEEPSKKQNLFIPNDEIVVVHMASNDSRAACMCAQMMHCKGGRADVARRKLNAASDLDGQIVRLSRNV